jgi:glucose-1-phosphate cytidylyltransferase
VAAYGVHCDGADGMKTVLFCGGLGMRIRDYAENVPKPLVPIGYRPILWHLMKYYAHYGHTDFVLALGYRADMIKSFFLNYEEAVSNDLIVSEGGRKREMLTSDIEDWRISLIETGLNANIGMRLRAVRQHVAGEEMFLANYADSLTDLPLDEQIEAFRKSDAVASFVSVIPNLSYHFIEADKAGRVTAIRDIANSGLRLNGGFFIFRQEIFDYLHEGEELVVEPFERLIKAKKLQAFHYDGFWTPMDTAKDRQKYDELWSSGNTPWTVWKKNTPAPAKG